MSDEEVDAVHQRREPKGCTDGVLLPSLSKYFANVAGIDQDNGTLNTVRLLAKKHR